MKNKSWIIILIMGIALTISIAYSIVVSQRKANPGESTVTTKSIIEMAASTVTIKNTLTGSGEIEYKEKAIDDNNTNESTNLYNEITSEMLKNYQINL